MENLSTWFSSGAAIVAIILLSVKSYMEKRKEETKSIIKLDKDNAVHNAVQDIKIDYLEKRVTKLEKP